MKKYGYEKKERNIIVNSAYAKDNFSVLYDFMKDTDALSERDAALIADRDLKHLISREAIIEILSRSRDEWRIIKEANGEHKVKILADRVTRCEICNTKIRFVCYIHNVLTGIELEVGRECIKKYDIDSGEYKALEKTMQNKITDHKKVIALQIFDENTDGLREYVRSIQYTIPNAEIYIPSHLQLQFNENLIRSRELENKFIELGQQIDFEEYILTVNRLKNNWDEINAYISENINRRWILTNQMNRNLRKFSQSKLTELHTSGVITANTISIISQQEFCVSIAEELNRHLIPLDMEIISVEGSSNLAQILYRMKKFDIRIFVKHSDLMEAFAGILFDPTFILPSFQAFIKQKQISFPEDSHITLLKMLSSALPNGCYFDYDIIDDISFFICLNGYKTLGVNGLIDILGADIISNNKMAIQKWYIEINRKPGWIPLSELKEDKAERRRRRIS